MNKTVDVSRADSEREGNPRENRRRRVGLAAGAALLSTLAFTTVALAATGNLAQKSGTDGCISVDGTAGDCADGTALTGASGVTVSPDGKNAYVASKIDNSVSVFDVDSSGNLTQKSGTDGCISEDGTDGACADGKALGGAQAVTVSPDGKNVYVASGIAVAVLDRDTSTGALTQKSGTDGCISEDGTSGAPNFSPGACVNGVALNGPSSVAVSPDGKNVYAAAPFSDAVDIFDRDTANGKLTQKAGTDGCISKTSTGGACVFGTAVDGATTITVSPDGENAYAASYFSDAVDVFDRDATTGKLTQKSGTDACVSQSGSAGACADGTALDGAQGVAISPDGKSAYVTSHFSDSVTIFDRNASTGVLTQKSGTDGCISQTGSGGDCVDGVALNSAGSVTVSPDDKNVYVASPAPSDAIAVIDRDTSNGKLTQKAGTEGCISETGTGGLCLNGVALNGANSVAVAPDGKTAYGAASDSNAVSVFTREGGKLEGKATADKTQKQKGKQIAVKVQVKGDEALNAEATGTISIKKKSYSLHTVRKSVAAGKKATLNLKPKKDKNNKKIAKGLKKSKGKATISVKLADPAGNSKKTNLSVTLKR